MIIGLLDVDNYGKLDKCFPNLSLMQVSAFYKKRGFDVEMWDKTKTYMIVIKFKVFSFTPEIEVDNAVKVYEIGSGYAIHLENGVEVFDHSKYHPLNDECKTIYPDYDIYGITDTAYGFTSVGCPRKCGFCHVYAMQGGNAHRVQSVYNFYKDQKHIQLYDPNVLACPDWREILLELKYVNAKVEFNQGLDVRLLTPEKIKALKEINLVNVHFAYDSMSQGELIEQKLIEWTKEVGIKFNRSKVQCYILTNYDTTFEDDLHRVMFCRKLGISPYIMRYNKESIPRGSISNALARWCNNRVFFWKYENFTEYMKHRNDRGANV